jgi:hypothetical protein
LRQFLITALLLAAAVAQAEPLQLIAPANGDVLRGGRFATLAWAADRLGNDAEEWEAFLSVDGGRFYSVRLTPHLDINTRRFDALIPNVDSDDVRILIRTGNERNETILTMPLRLHIRAEAVAVRPSQTPAEGPESARPNEPRVVQWSVGDHVEASATPDAIRAVKTISERTKWGVGNRGSEERLPTPDSRLPIKHSRPPQPARCSLETSDVLLRSSRLNV